MRVLVFGDSIVQGFWDREGGWVQRLRKQYDAERIDQLPNSEGADLFNVGISGDRTDEILRRLETEIVARRWHEDPLAVVIAVGVNDSYIKNDQPYSSPEAYGQKVERLIEIAQKQTKKLLLLELTPCDEKYTTPVTWDNIHWTNERLAQFNSTLQATCQNHQVPLVKLFEAFSEEQRQRNLLIDGLHPNDAGHKLIASLVQPELEKLLAS